MSVPFNDVNGIERSRQARKAKMQEIIPGLWLGSQEALHDQDLLERCDITYIISVMPTFIDETGVQVTRMSPEVYQYTDGGVSRLIIPAEDISTQNLLQYFPRSTEFILAALCNDGKVLVHCLAGASRSPSVVAAFLMEVYQLSPSQAISKIRESRPFVRPIISFFDQLQVYEACGYRPLNQPVYLHWMLRLQCETEIDRPGNGLVLPSGKPLARIPTTIPYVSTETPQLICAMCHKILAPATYVLPLQNDGGDDYYLAQPMDWMSPEFDNREHEGSLACTKCENVVGEYNWNGKRNLNGRWITPAFVLLKEFVAKSGAWE